VTQFPVWYLRLGGGKRSDWISAISIFGVHGRERKNVPDNLISSGVTVSD